MIPHRAASVLAAAAAVPVLLAGAGPAAAVPPAAGTVLGPGARADQAPARISGEIHDHHDSGWVVELTRPGEDAPAYSVDTGGGTTFEFTGVVPGEYLLQASHPESGTTGPPGPVTLRPGDNGSTDLVFTGPPPEQLPERLAPLTGRVAGAGPGTTGVVVEVLHDRDGELVQVSSAPVAEDGSFSVDPRAIEDYALPLHLRAVRTLPDGSTEPVYHGQSPTPAGSVPIVPAEGVLEHYELSFTEAYGAPAPTGSARPTGAPSPDRSRSPGPASSDPATGQPPTATERPAAGAEETSAGLPAALWAVLGAVVVSVAAAVAVVRRRRAG